ncbi:MAG: DNA-binding protein [Pseudomonadota bacterium]|nr:DNA-binding protein [Pseudomonadota bacterium]
MQQSEYVGVVASNGKSRSHLTPLDQEARAYLPTAEAAPHLGRAPQTLRKWACHELGPLRPRRVNGRLAWAVADIRRVMGV